MSDIPTPPDEPVSAKRPGNPLTELQTVKEQLNVLTAAVADVPTREQLEIRLQEKDEEIEYRRARGRAASAALIILAALTLLVMVVGGAILLKFSADNHKNATTLVECTTPGTKTPTADHPFDTGHACFDRGNEQTAKAIQSISDNERYLVECAFQNFSTAPTDLSLKACIAAKQVAASKEAPGG